MKLKDLIKVLPDDQCMNILLFSRCGENTLKSVLHRGLYWLDDIPTRYLNKKVYCLTPEDNGILVIGLIN